MTIAFSSYMKKKCIEMSPYCRKNLLANRENILEILYTFYARIDTKKVILNTANHSL